MNDAHAHINIDMLNDVSSIKTCLPRRIWVPNYLHLFFIYLLTVPESFGIVTTTSNLLMRQTIKT